MCAITLSRPVEGTEAAAQRSYPQKRGCGRPTAREGTEVGSFRYGGVDSLLCPGCRGPPTQTEAIAKGWCHTVMGSHLGPQ